MTTELTGRAKFQIAVTVGERCRQGWQDGWSASAGKPAVADAAVTAAAAALSAEASLERLIFEALRRCPRPGA